VQGQENLQRPADAGVVVHNQYFSTFDSHSRVQS
jgi:hypothetical protein